MSSNSRRFLIGVAGAIVLAFVILGGAFMGALGLLAGIFAQKTFERVQLNSCRHASCIKDGRVRVDVHWRSPT